MSATGPKVQFAVNSLKEEKEIIKVTKEKIKWFKKNRYPFTLPNKPLEMIYNPKDYFKKIKEIERKWVKQEEEFFSALEDFFGKRFQKNIIVHASKYGVAGGYSLPNHVYINIDLVHDPVKTIQHEIVHLVVEPFVQKYKIDHRKKEKIVDAIMELFK